MSFWSSLILKICPFSPKTRSLFTMGSYQEIRVGRPYCRVSLSPEITPGGGWTTRDRQEIPLVTSLLNSNHYIPVRYRGHSIIHRPFEPPETDCRAKRLSSRSQRCARIPYRYTLYSYTNTTNPLDIYLCPLQHLVPTFSHEHGDCRASCDA